MNRLSRPARPLPPARRRPRRSPRPSSSSASSPPPSSTGCRWARWHGAWGWAPGRAGPAGVCCGSSSPTPSTRRSLVGALVGAVAAAGSSARSRHTGSSVRSATVRAATREMARGRYAVPVPVPHERELAELATDVNTLGQALAETEARRVRLLGEVAHEMRTPLTVIEGYVEGMIDGVMPTTSAELGQVGAEVQRLRRLSEDLSVALPGRGGAARPRPGERRPRGGRRGRGRAAAAAGRGRRPAARRRRRRWPPSRSASTPTGSPRSSRTSSATPCGPPHPGARSPCAARVERASAGRLRVADTGEGLARRTWSGSSSASTGSRAGARSARTPGRASA